MFRCDGFHSALACAALTALAIACATRPAPTSDRDGPAAEPAPTGGGRQIAEAAGTIRRVSDEWFAIVPDSDPGTRYAPDALPAELRRDGLRVVFSGTVGEIPPEVRMWGTPLELSAIRRLEE